MEKNTYTLKDLQKETHAPAWLVYYLRNNNRLPVAKDSAGRGFSTQYRLEAVKVIKEHMARQEEN